MCLTKMDHVVKSTGEPETCCSEHYRRALCAMVSKMFTRFVFVFVDIYLEILKRINKSELREQVVKSQVARFRCDAWKLRTI